VSPDSMVILARGFNSGAVVISTGSLAAPNVRL